MVAIKVHISSYSYPTPFLFLCFESVIDLFFSINVGKIEYSFKSSCRRYKKSKEWYVLHCFSNENFIFSCIKGMLFLKQLALEVSRFFLRMKGLVLVPVILLVLVARKYGLMFIICFPT